MTGRMFFMFLFRAEFRELIYSAQRWPAPSFTKQAITSCVTVTSIIQFESGENARGYKHTHTRFST